LIANAEDMVSHYQEAMMDFLNDTQGDQSTVDFAQDLTRLGKTLLDLSANYPSTALPAFRQELGAGHTMMMFGSKDFDQLEAWSKAGEDFQIAIFRENGLPIGVIQKEYINW
jgi:hypothetical protein